MRKHIIATLAAAAALSTGLSMAPITAVAAPRPPTTVTPMNAVPNSRCAPIGHLYNGLCFGYTADGKQIYNWLGTYDSPAGPGWGLDYIYTTGFGSGAKGSIETSSLGTRIGESEEAALGALTTYTPPKGSSNTDVAAVALVIREVMGDGSSPSKGQIIPGGLKAGGTVKKTDRLAIPPSVYTRAQELWSYASSHYAPELSLTSPVSEAATGDPVDFTATLKWGDGSPVVGARINLDFAPRYFPDPGVPETMYGPTSVTTDANGKATFQASVAMGIPSRTYEAWATTADALILGAPGTWVPNGWSVRGADAFPGGPTRVVTAAARTEQTVGAAGYITK